LSLKLSLENLEFDGEAIVVGPGVILALLLNKSLTEGLVGLEFVTGIPGTVGGAIRGNAGTYGLAMDSVVKKIKYLDEDFKLQEIDAEAAEFSYRHSIFKEKPWIIVGAELKLQKGDVKEAQKLIMERRKYRQETQPNLPSAGCIFKNVRFEDVDLEKLKTKNIDIARFTKFKKIPSAYLIEKAGLKGHKIGDAQISEVHANYIVNLGSATAEDVIILISSVVKKIKYLDEDFKLQEKCFFVYSYFVFNPLIKDIVQLF